MGTPVEEGGNAQFDHALNRVWVLGTAGIGPTVVIGDSGYWGLWAFGSYPTRMTTYLVVGIRDCVFGTYIGKVTGVYGSK